MKHAPASAAITVSATVTGSAVSYASTSTEFTVFVTLFLALMFGFIAIVQEVNI